MNPLHQFSDLDRVALPPGPVHLAIGVFDGVHRGHQAVIAGARAAARQDGGRAGVLTFHPHPAAVLRPEPPTRLILPREVKLGLLADLGLDFVIEQPFTPAFAATPAADFAARLRTQLPGLATVHVGVNFRFGRGGAGNPASLAAVGRSAGFTVRIAPRLEAGGTPVSSSRLRALLADGDVATANALLGYTYFADATVERGRQLGRTLGFPTLNLRWAPELAPRHGVYAVVVTGPDGRPLPGVANYGIRPTVTAGGEPWLEVHVLEGRAPDYGDRVRVHWAGFLRPERKFGGVEELRGQIAADAATAREALRGWTVRKIPGAENPNSA